MKQQPAAPIAAAEERRLRRVNDGAFSNDRTPSRLLEGLKASDEEARRQLNAAYEPVLRSILRRCSLSAEERDDLAQVFWMKVYSKVGSFRKEQPDHSLRGWLRTIARNLLIDHQRAKGAREGAEGGSDNVRLLAELPDDGQLPDAVESAERVAMLQGAMERLRSEVVARDWENFHRTTVGGESIAATARAAGMKPEALRMANARVRRKLRQFLADLWD